LFRQYFARSIFMSRKAQVSFVIAEHRDGLQLWDRSLGLLAIWGSIRRLGSAIIKEVR
jgi:hypothetical protein